MAQYKNIDIIPDSTVNRIYLSQGDVGRTLIFYLFENALSWSVPASSTIKCQGTKPSGFGFSVNCTYSGNTVTCVTTDEMTDEYGQIEAELVITSSDESQIFGTSNFILDIEKNPHPSSTEDGGADTAIALTARVEALETAVSELEASEGLTDAIKLALLQLASKVAYIDDDGQDYYDDLYDALYPPAPPATLTSISAVYTQSETVYSNTSLDSLKTDLVVTAHYDDSSTQTVSSSAYTLSGTLTVGTSAVTVSYGGKTTTFNVTVSAGSGPLYCWDFTNSLIDVVSNVEATIDGYNTSPTRSSSGLLFNAAQQYINFGDVMGRDKTLEIDVANFDFKGTTSYNLRFVMLDTGGATKNSSTADEGALIWRHNNVVGWSAYVSGAWASGSYTGLSGSTTEVINYFNNKTVKIYIDEDGYPSLYVDGTLIGDLNVAFPVENTYLSFGSSDTGVKFGGQLYDCLITGVRIYDGEV